MSAFIISPLLQLIAAGLLLALGLRLSAFFSGAETGFYRASFLRISIDAQAGDPISKRLVWFARNPSAFVATTLVGNNVANYLTTLAIGLMTFALVQTHAEWLEIAGTLLIAPIVFVFGELLPKNLYYRAPLMLLRRDANRFVFFYYLFLLVSFPLIGISKLFEKLGQPEEEQTGLVLGRTRLVQVLSQGHREGLLTEVQTRLVHGIMNAASSSMGTSYTPCDRVLGVKETATREEILDYARRYGIAVVPIHKTGDPKAWFGYVRVIDLAVARQSVSSLMFLMPSIPAGSSKLDALLKLRETGQNCGVVMDGGQVLGVVSTHGLVEQLFRPPHVPNPEHD